MIEAVDGVGRREIETRWESVKGLGDEEGFNRMVEYLSMRLFGDGYWWEFEAEAEKEGKQKVGEGVKNFIEKVRIFAEKLGWDESKIKRTVLLGVREEFRGWLEVGGKYRRNWMMMDLEEIVFNFENAEDSIGFPSHPPFPHSSYEVILHFKGFLLIVLVPWYGTGKVR